MIQINRILLPTDFSDTSRQATAYALELSRRLDAQLHLLHVVPSPVTAMPSPGAPLPSSVSAEMYQTAETQLKAWMSDEDVEGSVSREVLQGAPADEIVRYGQKENVDLIVLGTHGRSGLEHALIGSVAEKVVRNASCPVLTVKPDGQQFVTP